MYMTLSPSLIEEQMECASVVAVLTELLPGGAKTVEEICSKLTSLPGPAMMYLDNLRTELLSGTELEHTYVWRKINV